MNNEQVFIIGGGSSLTQLINLGLWSHLKNTCTIGVNFSFKDYLPTVLCTADFKFYTANIDCVWEKDSQGNDYLNTHIFNPTFRNQLENLPLIIAPARTDMMTGTLDNRKLAKMNNTIFLPYTTAHKYYGNESKPNEIYHVIDQSGMFALGVACEIPTVKEIFLLGFDFNVTNGKSHYYNHTNHRGLLPKVNSWYERHEKSVGANYYYKPFLDRYPNVKIYNVNLNSKITCFGKLTPDLFFDKIKKGHPENQNALRNNIKSVFK